MPRFEHFISYIQDTLDIFSLETFIFYIAIALLSFIIEWAIVGWEKSSIKKLLKFQNSVRTDIIFFLMNAFKLYDLITIGLSFGICHFITYYINLKFQIDLILHIKNYYLEIFILFMVSDIKTYYAHYLLHRFPLLWQLHELHHSATSMCVFTKYRDHFLERAFRRLLDVIPIVILGSTIETYLILQIILETHKLLIHSNIKSDWGWIGKYILVSPSAHKIHHSNQIKHYDKNFGNTLIVWDRLFGTYYRPETVNEMGVPNNEYNKKGFVYDVFKGIQKFSKNLVTRK